MKPVAMRVPTLRTDRLVLRSFRLDDAQAVFAYASDPRVTRYLRFTTHRSLADTRKFLKHVDKAHPGSPLWAVTLCATGELIGGCGFGEYSRPNARAEIGYVLARAHWGRAYAAEAVCALLEYGFRRLKLERIHAQTFVENTRSGRVLEKAGLRYEGTLRAWERIKGRSRDMRMYSMVRSEFRCRRRSGSRALFPQRSAGR